MSSHHYNNNNHALSQPYQYNTYYQHNNNNNNNIHVNAYPQNYNFISSDNIPQQPYYTYYNNNNNFRNSNANFNATKSMQSNPFFNNNYQQHYLPFNNNNNAMYINPQQLTFYNSNSHHNIQQQLYAQQQQHPYEQPIQVFDNNKNRQQMEYKRYLDKQVESKKQSEASRKSFESANHYRGEQVLGNSGSIDSMVFQQKLLEKQKKENYREILQMQIQEKNKRKQLEKEKEREYDMKLDQKVQQEIIKEQQLQQKQNQLKQKDNKTNVNINDTFRQRPNSSSRIASFGKEFIKGSGNKQEQPFKPINELKRTILQPQNNIINNNTTEQLLDNLTKEIINANTKSPLSFENNTLMNKQFINNVNNDSITGSSFGSQQRNNFANTNEMFKQVIDNNIRKLNENYERAEENSIRRTNSQQYQLNKRSFKNNANQGMLIDNNKITFHHSNSDNTTITNNGSGYIVKPDNRGIGVDIGNIDLNALKYVSKYENMSTLKKDNNNNNNTFKEDTLMQSLGGFSKLIPPDNNDSKENDLLLQTWKKEEIANTVARPVSREKSKQQNEHSIKNESVFRTSAHNFLNSSTTNNSNSHHGITGKLKISTKDYNKLYPQNNNKHNVTSLSKSNKNSTNDYQIDLNNKIYNEIKDIVEHKSQYEPSIQQTDDDDDDMLFPKQTSTHEGKQMNNKQLKINTMNMQDTSLDDFDNSKSDNYKYTETVQNDKQNTTNGNNNNMQLDSFSDILIDDDDNENNNDNDNNKEKERPISSQSSGSHRYRISKYSNNDELCNVRYSDDENDHHNDDNDDKQNTDENYKIGDEIETISISHSNAKEDEEEKIKRQMNFFDEDSKFNNINISQSKNDIVITSVDKESNNNNKNRHMNLFESTSKVKHSYQTEDNNTEHNTTKFVNDSYCDNIIANINKYRKMAAMNSKEGNNTVNNNDNDDEDNVMI